MSLAYATKLVRRIMDPTEYSLDIYVPEVYGMATKGI